MHEPVWSRSSRNEAVGFGEICMSFVLRGCQNQIKVKLFCICFRKQKKRTETHSVTTIEHVGNICYIHLGAACKGLHETGDNYQLLFPNCSLAFTVCHLSLMESAAAAVSTTTNVWNEFEVSVWLSLAGGLNEPLINGHWLGSCEGQTTSNNHAPRSSEMMSLPFFWCIIILNWTLRWNTKHALRFVTSLDHRTFSAALTPCFWTTEHIFLRSYRELTFQRFVSYIAGVESNVCNLMWVNNMDHCL